MEKKTKRDAILYAHIQNENNIWIKQTMKKLGYPKTRGKSEFVDKLLTKLRIGSPLHSKI